MTSMSLISQQVSPEHGTWLCTDHSYEQVQTQNSHHLTEVQVSEAQLPWATLHHQGKLNPFLTFNSRDTLHHVTCQEIHPQLKMLFGHSGHRQECFPC